MSCTKYLRSVLESLWAGFFMLCMIVLHPLLHRMITQWGCTDEETRMVLPGDDLVPDEASNSTFAITINRQPAVIWPWIVQLGCGRGNFYSYDFCENMFGCSCTWNAEQIVPEWQSPSVGDTIYKAHRKCFPSISQSQIVIIEPEKRFVIGQEDEGIWAFHLVPIKDTDTTRFIIRIRAKKLGNPLSKCVVSVILHVLFEPIHFVMQRKMMLGIKYRAENIG
jgi:hypothetical protein